MAKKQFKAESKKLLDMMINSIYTHKEIFMRELISNASDALDKLYFKKLGEHNGDFSKDDLCINITADKEKRTITIADNGIGMTKDELENNLGVIAKSGSLDFKTENEKTEDIDVIGQFGVGFYSAFMVAKKITVESKAYGEDTAHKWVSSGADGYTITDCEKDDCGTVITLEIKENTENDSYDEFLEQYKIKELVKKYSDYIRYPIKMEVEKSVPVETDDKDGEEDKEPEFTTVKEIETLNSMVPLWHKNKNEISEDEYNQFYKDRFHDYEDPAKVIHSKTEGQVSYDSLMFIPKRPPYDFYTKDYEKGLALYANGVLIMEKCKDLLPDHFSFVKGLVDSADLSLNISREILQHDHQLKIIAKAIDKKICSELKKMLSNERENYEEFFKAFGIQLKFGVYNNYGMYKDSLKDLLIYISSAEEKYTTLAEYVLRMKDGQDTIYYACGDSIDKIKLLPQTEAVKDKGYEILYMTDNVDEFALQMLMEYDGKKFKNICDGALDLDTEEEKEQLKTKNEEAKDMLGFIKESLKDEVTDVKFTDKLKSSAVCLSSEGYLSMEMEKVLKTMPNANDSMKAQLVLEINSNHSINDKLNKLYNDDKETLKKFAKLLYYQARLISGLEIENPSEFSNLICEFAI
ncbi:MAG: molecular chaperone HtpG, partial [Acutalibacteraceae bacterium]